MVELTKVRHPMDPTRVRVQLDASTPVMTKQSEKNKTDINKIIQKFVKAGGIPPLPLDTQFGFAPELTFHDAMNAIRNADEYFSALPSEARKRFGNDPGQFLDFVNDPANIDELSDMGLIDLPESPEPSPTPVAEASGDPTPAEPAE